MDKFQKKKTVCLCYTLSLKPFSVELGWRSFALRLERFQQRLAVDNRHGKVRVENVYVCV